MFFLPERYEPYIFFYTREAYFLPDKHKHMHAYLLLYVPESQIIKCRISSFSTREGYLLFLLRDMQFTVFLLPTFGLREFTPFFCITVFHNLFKVCTNCAMQYAIYACFHFGYSLLTRKLVRVPTSAYCPAKNIFPQFYLLIPNSSWPIFSLFSILSYWILNISSLKDVLRVQMFLKKYLHWVHKPILQ